MKIVVCDSCHHNHRLSNYHVSLYMRLGHPHTSIAVVVVWMATPHS